jgi:hypothetical protein
MTFSEAKRIIAAAKASAVKRQKSSEMFRAKSGK